MRTTVLLALAVGLVVGADAKDDVKKEQAKLKGTWQLVSEIQDGNERPADDVKKLKLTFDADGNWKVFQDEQMLFEGTTKFDTTKKPRTVDYTITTDGDLKGKTVTAIYQWDGEDFKHCWAPPDQDRPTAFESKGGTGHTLSVFRRGK